jgi:metallo-beta-lactamase family protein
VRDGYGGPIHATAATVDLCSVMLPDSGHIQEMEVEQLNRRNARRGRKPVEPIYTSEDAADVLTRFRPAEYGRWTPVARGIEARFWNAGHLLGSASVELRTDGTTILFSGDIGPGHKPLQDDPEAPAGVDYLVCESTYGDRVREAITPEGRRARLRDEVRAAMAARGPLIIPSFAVERTQELLVDLTLLVETGELPAIPIFIDSPLATRASAVFARHAGAIAHGDVLRRAMQSAQVRFTETVEQSKAIGRIHGFFIVISASGMCEAGRIRHHLKDWLWRSEATVLLIGYQAQGTLGRILQDGAARVRIQGDAIEVRARIRTLDLYSGHADADRLVAWIEGRRPIRRGIFLVHGEAEARDALRARLGDRNVFLPQLDDVYALTPDGAEELAPAERRIAPERLGRLDSHNDLSRLLLDIGAAADRIADDRGRAVLVRRLRRALEDEG